jgi:hypothetical protein
MDDVHPRTIRGNPITNTDLEFYIDTEEDVDSDSYRIELTQNHLNKIDPDNGTFTYVIEDEKKTTVITFTKESSKANYRWQDAI